MKVPPQTTKLYLAGVFLLTLALLVFVQAAFNLSPFFSPSEPNQIVLLVTLSTFIFLVLLVFGFVLLRTLVKVWAERRVGKPGSKFKTKLVFTLILLTLIPATCLFGFAFGLVNRSIDKWFSVPVDEIFEATSEMSAFMVLDEKGQVVRSSAIPDGIPPGLPDRIVSALRSRDEAVIDIDTHWIRAQRIDAPQGKQIQAAVFPKLARIDELTSKIGMERANYNLLIQRRKSYRDSLIYILLLMTVLVLFSAVWIGLFLSKKITVPIEALSEATRELSAGDLSHRVNIRAEDGLGLDIHTVAEIAGGQLSRGFRQRFDRNRDFLGQKESDPDRGEKNQDGHQKKDINQTVSIGFPPLDEQVVIGPFHADFRRQLVDSGEFGKYRSLNLFSLRGVDALGADPMGIDVDHGFIPAAQRGHDPIGQPRWNAVRNRRRTHHLAFFVQHHERAHFGSRFENFVNRNAEPFVNTAVNQSEGESEQAGCGNQRQQDQRKDQLGLELGAGFPYSSFRPHLHQGAKQHKAEDQ